MNLLIHGTPIEETVILALTAESFVLRTKSEADLATLATLVPTEQTRELDASWVKESLVFAVFQASDDAIPPLVVRTQGQADAAKLRPIVPLDQEHPFEASWKDGELVLAKLAKRVKAAAAAAGDDQDDEPDPAAVTLKARAALLAEMNDADLDTLAAELHVERKPKHSRETFVSNVAKAQAKAEKDAMAVAGE